MVIKGRDRAHHFAPVGPLKYWLVCFLLLPFTLQAQQPTVENVRFKRDGKFVIVTYDLSGSGGPIRQEIGVIFSSDGGNTFDIAPKALFGAVGKGVMPGTNRTIVWLVPKDNFPGLAIDSLQPKVTVAQTTIASAAGGNTALAGLVIVAGGAAGYYIYLENLKKNVVPLPEPPGRP